MSLNPPIVEATSRVPDQQRREVGTKALSALPNGNFADAILRRLGENSHLIDAATGEKVDAFDVPELIVGFAIGLAQAGLRPNDRILIGCELSPASTLAYFGAMHAGLVPILIEARAAATTGEALCRTKRARAVWTRTPLGGDWVEKLGLLRFAGLFDPCAAEAVESVAREENDLAALMPTSGSTGTPRLVMVSHGNLLANTDAIARSQRLGTDERAMLVLPISYCFGASVVHTHLYQGGSVVFDSRFMFPDKVLRAIDTHHCTTFAGVPTAYNVLLRRSSLASIPLPSLRRFLQAGGALGPEEVKKLGELVPGAQVYVMYGQTEATARISCLPPERLTEKLGSAGLPMDNLTVRIVDEEGREVGKGEVGEIWVKGPSVTHGYLDDEAETARKFQAGWLKTGDQALMDADGYLWLKGRKGDFLKIRGVRVSFAEVETLLGSVGGVRECAVKSSPHPEAGEALTVFVVPENGAMDLEAAVRKALPSRWDCNEVRIVEELPKTANGKIARHRLGTEAAPAPLSPATLGERIDELLKAPTYAYEPKQRTEALLGLLKDELTYACERNARFKTYVAHWPLNYGKAERLADLPYLPVGVFKSNPPLSLIEAGEVSRVLTSSATTGQIPSRVALDGATAKRMTKGVSTIIKNFIGTERRPYLVIDTPETLSGRGEMGARAAAVQGLRSFATEIVCCLRQGEAGKLDLDVELLQSCAARWKDTNVLVYGFTFVLWKHLVEPLKAMGASVSLPNIHVLHSGGWKRLQSESVTKEAFNAGVAAVFGAPRERVIDFYGAVENVGVVFPDCEFGNKHAPAFAEVIVRDPLTLAPVAAGGRGLVQVCSVLPTSFPGFSTLTEDIAEIVAYDGCPCGRRGTSFKFIGRAPKAEVRGCGNVETGGRRTAKAGGQ